MSAKPRRPKERKPNYRKFAWRPGEVAIAPPVTDAPTDPLPPRKLLERRRPA